MRTIRHATCSTRVQHACRWSRRAGLFLAGLALACGATSCGKAGGEASGKGGKGKRAVPVTAAVAVSEPVPLEIKTFGTVEPSSTVSIRALVTETIETVHFTKGQMIRKGDVLFTLDPRTFKANLDQVQANLARDQAQAENSRKEYERQEALLAKGVASQTDYDKAKAEAEAQAAVVAADRAAVERARLDVEHCTIVSPIDGRAGDVLQGRGNLVKANETVLVVIHQISPIEVHFSVAQDEFLLARKYSDAGKCLVEAWDPKESGTPESGELFFIDNAIDKATGTVVLGAMFANAHERLWPGQYVNIRLVLAIQDKVVIPSRAVQIGRNEKYVFVVRPDNTVEIRPVVVGAADTDRTVVQQGLQAGEQVVTDGQLQLVPGTPVQVKAAAAASGPASRRLTAPASTRAAE